MNASEQAAPPRSFLPMAGGVLMLLAFLFLLYIAYLTVRPVLLAVVLAAALASLAAGFFRWMVVRLHGRRRLASLVCVLLLFIGVLVPFGFVGTIIVKRLVVEATDLTRHLQTGGPLTIEMLAPRLGPLGAPLQRAIVEIRPKLAAAAPQIAGQVGGLLAGASRAALHIAIGVFILSVALYYFFLEGHKWRERFVHLAPLPADDTNMFFDRFHRVSVAVLVGNFGTALAQATAATLGYFIFGAPAPLIWGAATLFAALIPLVGPALIWLPVAIVVGIDRGWLHGGGMIIYGILVVSTVDNVVRPLLTRRGLQLHPLLVFIAVLGGTISFGIAGLFVGPLVVALVITVLDVYERHVQTEV